MNSSPKTRVRVLTLLPFPLTDSDYVCECLPGFEVLGPATTTSPLGSLPYLFLSAPPTTSCHPCPHPAWNVGVCPGRCSSVARATMIQEILTEEKLSRLRSGCCWNVDICRNKGSAVYQLAVHGFVFQVTVSSHAFSGAS